MKSLKSYLVAAGLAIVFAAVFALAGNILFTPSAEAQNKSDKQWEVLVVRGGAMPEGLQGILNSKGEEGWEPVEVVQSKDGNYVAYLKRRKQ